MNVLICVNNSLRYCPYANFYIDLCRKEAIDYCVMYPDRGGLKEDYDFKTIRYGWDDKQSSSLQLLKYRKFALKTIQEQNYDYIFALTTGTAVLLSRALLKKNRKYIVDVRDYTREDNFAYKFIEDKVIRRAKGVLISSPDFREFLPKRDYIDIYNASGSIESKEEVNINCSIPIKIAYIGTIAYPEQCEKLMVLVEKDERFRFDLYGNDLNGSRIENFIKKNNLKGSHYWGSYQPIEKPGIIRNTDILFNAYGNRTPLLKYALSNKLTDAAIYKKVVLNSPDTCMNKLLGNCSYPIDLDTEIDLNKLYEWYSGLDVKDTQEYLDGLLRKIITTNGNAYKKVTKLLVSCD